MSEIKIIPYSNDLKKYFYDINYEWVSSMFEMEEADVEMLENPEDKILKSGGEIWFAEHESLGIVGTCALIKVSEGVYELTKMGVFKSARGLKVGEQLLKFVINFTRDQDIETLFLLTNKNCEAAIHLYEKNGFVHCSDIMKLFGEKYDRSNVAMRLAR